MKEYILIFRMDIITPSEQPTPEQMQDYMVQWMNWINEISFNNQLANGGNHLSYTSGKVIRSNNTISDNPYIANNESVAGYIITLANNINEAVSIAKKCPILQGKGTSVEVRELETPQEMKEVKRNSK